jgi:hypothetical protein
MWGGRLFVVIMLLMLSQFSVDIKQVQLLVFDL